MLMCPGRMIHYGKFLKKVAPGKKKIFRSLRISITAIVQISG